MTDLKLKPNGDIYAQSRYVDGLEEVIQRVQIRFRTFAGEWVLDSRVGIPYIAWNGIKGVPFDVISDRLRLELETTPGIIAVTRFEASKDGDVVEVEARIIAADEEGPVSIGATLEPSSGIARVRIV
jgi:hypothetical protein